jgi:hypothetical protein
MGVVAEEDIGRRDGYERERRTADRPRGGISGCKGVRGFRGLVGVEVCETREGSEEVILRTRFVPQTPEQQKNRSIPAKKEHVCTRRFVLRCMRSGSAAGAATPVVRQPGSQTAAVYEYDHEILSELQLCRLRSRSLYADHSLRFLPLGSQASAHEERDLRR